MQLLDSHRSFPRATAGVMLLAFVCAGILANVSNVRARNATEQAAVPPMKNARAADFVSMGQVVFCTQDLQ